MERRQDQRREKKDEGRRSQGRPRNRWEDGVRKEANQFLRIRNWRLMADRRGDWRRKVGKAGLDLRSASHRFNFLKL